MKRITRTILLFLLSVLTIAQGCRDHEVVSPLNEEELITTVVLTFTELDDQGDPVGEPLAFSWRDEDGSGDPAIDEIVLSAQTTYALSIEISDESKTPAEDITEEIREESAEHQFFFAVDGAPVSIGYDDTDDDGKPLGLESLVTVGGSGAGSLTVILRHEPDKNADGVANGDLTNAGGDTDIEAEFPLTIVE